jgi:hypothetical protein
VLVLVAGRCDEPGKAVILVRRSRQFDRIVKPLRLGTTSFEHRSSIAGHVSNPQPPAETVPASPLPTQRWDRRLGHGGGATAMRSLLAGGLLIILCASADATTSAVALASTVRHKPNVRTYNLYRSTPLARSQHRNYGNPDGTTNLSDDGYTLWNGRSASEAGGD